MLWEPKNDEVMSHLGVGFKPIELIFLGVSKSTEVKKKKKKFCPVLFKSTILSTHHFYNAFCVIVKAKHYDYFS